VAGRPDGQAQAHWLMAEREFAGHGRAGRPQTRLLAKCRAVARPTSSRRGGRSSIESRSAVGLVRLEGGSGTALRRGGPEGVVVPLTRK
jgi:hypothetical protein